MKTKKILVEFEYDAELDEATAFEHIEIRMDGWDYGVSHRLMKTRTRGFKTTAASGSRATMPSRSLRCSARTR